MCVHVYIRQTFAVLWKRGWAEEGDEGKQEFFTQIQALAQQPDRAVRLRLCLILRLRWWI